MSWLSDIHELVPGGWLSSAYDGHGILGADVPDDGQDGPGTLFKDLVSPDDDAKEVRLFIEEVPAGLTSCFFGEDGRIIAAGPDGEHVGSGRLFADGVDMGAAPIVIYIGETAQFDADNIWRVPAEDRIWRAQ